MTDTPPIQPKTLTRNLAFFSVILLACGFPIGATLVDIAQQNLPLTAATILALHTEQPLHWIIDAFPILIAFLVLSAREEQEKQPLSRPALSNQIEQKVTERTAKLSKIIADLKAEIAGAKRTEETLRTSEEFYRNLVENANDGIVTISLDGIVTTVNRGLEIMLGRPREELVGQPYRLVVSPLFLAQVEEQFRRFQVEKQFPSTFETGFVHKGGGVVPVEARVRIISDNTGNPIGLQGIYRDITKRREAEGKTLASQAVPQTPYPILAPEVNLQASHSPHEPLAMPELLSSAGLTLGNKGKAESASTPTLYRSPKEHLDTEKLKESETPFVFKLVGEESAASESPEPEVSNPSFALLHEVELPKPEKTEHELVSVPEPSVEHAGEVINLKEALDRVDGDHELLIEIAELFLAECPRFLTEIHTALSQNDAQTLTLAVHTLKGSVGNFAAAGAYEAALKLERIGRQGNLSQAPDALATLEAQLARLKPVLESLKMKAVA